MGGNYSSGDTLGSNEASGIFCNISAFIMVTEKFRVREITNLPWLCMSFTRPPPLVTAKQRKTLFNHLSHLRLCLQMTSLC